MGEAAETRELEVEGVLVHKWYSESGGACWVSKKKTLLVFGRGGEAHIKPSTAYTHTRLLSHLDSVVRTQQLPFHP